MANMSYCRFKNTLADLKDCEDNMNFDNVLDDDFEAQDMGNDERVARKELIRMCVDIARNYGDEVED